MKPEHIPSCAQIQKRRCFLSVILHGTEEHRWSGWPGAYCLLCHAEDPNEICLADSCACHCHDEMWRALEAYNPSALPSQK